MTMNVEFASSASGRQPVLEWIRKLPTEDRKMIGQDLRVLQENWPMGAPLCKAILARPGFYELRSKTSRVKSLRIIFSVESGKFVLLNLFVKKQDAVPNSEIRLADKRLSEHMKIAA